MCYIVLYVGTVLFVYVQQSAAICLYCVICMMLSCFFGLHVYLPQNSPSPRFDSLDEKLCTGPWKVIHWSLKSYTLVLEKLYTGPHLDLWVLQGATIIGGELVVLKASWLSNSRVVNKTQGFLEQLEACPTAFCKEPFVVLRQDGRLDTWLLFCFNKHKWLLEVGVKLN